MRRLSSQSQRYTPAAPAARSTGAAVLGLLLLLTSGGCGGDAPESRSATGGSAAPGDEWAMPAGDYANTRFSPLTQIDTSNVAGLRPVWSFDTGVLHGHEGQPLVVDNTMYVVTPFPNFVYAFDLTREGFPVKWKYRPDTNPASRGVACCDVVNRGAAYADGKIIFNLLDARTVALDARTGKEVWQTRIGDVNRGESATMAPLAIKDRVLVGVSGGEYGVRGRVAALDVANGEVLWTAWSTGPDEEVRIDSATFRPFYPQSRGRNLGVTTWPRDLWKTGGGTVWLWISYDPELDLFYYGTGNPGPWNSDQRPGDNAWTTATFARDPDDGYARWAYQHTPHDQWDYDGTNERILVDLPIGGRTRKALVFFDRNGFAYTMDRVTGEILVAEPYIHLNWASGLDPVTRKPIVVPDKAPGTGEWTRNFCPSHFGGKDQQPAAFSPRTRLFYVPSNNICEDWKMHEVNYIAGTPYMGVEAKLNPGPGGHLGEFIAWDAVAGKKVWSIREPYPLWGGALATAGEVVFYGTLDGWLKAVSARDGRLLWRYRVGSGVVGNPITFRGPDGKQYVALFSGIGGVPGFVIGGDIPSDKPYDTRSAGGLMPELAKHTTMGGTVWVFGL